MVAISLSAALACAVLGGLVWVSGVDDTPPSAVKIRKIDVAALPPPPPPPPPKRKVSADPVPELSINMSGHHGGPAVRFSSQPKLANITLDDIPQPDLQHYEMDVNATLANSIRSFKVEQLDAMPKIVSSRQTRIPRALRNQGINRVEVQVDILIDTRGKAHIRRIVDVGYPEMEAPLRDHIAAIQFTVPEKNGQPVNAEYLFIIKFSELL